MTSDFRKSRSGSHRERRDPQRHRNETILSRELEFRVSSGPLDHILCSVWSKLIPK